MKGIRLVILFWMLAGLALYGVNIEEGSAGAVAAQAVGEDALTSTVTSPAPGTAARSNTASLYEEKRVQWREPEEPGGPGQPFPDLAAAVPGNPNPTRSGEAFFTTDWDTADRWYAFALAGGDAYTAGLDRGVLYLELPERYQNVYVFYELRLVAPDVKLEAVVENRAAVTANNISLVCRAWAGGWYEFSINSGGFWHIWKLADGEFVELATGPTRVINQKRTKNVLTATCIGSELALYVNYRKVGAVKDRTFLDGGQVGVGMSSFGIPGAAVDFDRFSATLP